MRVTISYRPEESGFAEILKSYLRLRFPGGKLKQAKELNSHGNHVAYYNYQAQHKQRQRQLR